MLTAHTPGSMSTTRQSKRRITTPPHTMGNVTTCFRSLELDEPRDAGPAAGPATDNKFKGIFQVTRSDDDDSDHSTWADEEEDDGAWSSDDEDVIDNNSDDIWNSFSLPNIPYAHEYIEQQITITNVKIANKKSQQIYESSGQVCRANSLKKVQFRDEPDLVTVIH